MVGVLAVYNRTDRSAGEGRQAPVGWLGGEGEREVASRMEDGGSILSHFVGTLRRTLSRPSFVESLRPSRAVCEPRKQIGARFSTKCAMKWRTGRGGG